MGKSTGQAPVAEAPGEGKRRHSGCLTAVAVIVALLILVLVVGGSLTDDKTKGANEVPGGPMTTTPDGLTVEESAYIEGLYEDTKAMGESIVEIGELCGSYPFDDEEVVLIASDMATVKLIAEEYQEMDPPSERFVDLHRQIQLCFRDYAKGCDKLAYGIDHMDGEALDEAAALMNRGARRVERIGAELDAVELDAVELDAMGVTL